MKKRKCLPVQDEKGVLVKVLPPFVPPCLSVENVSGFLPLLFARLAFSSTDRDRCPLNWTVWFLRFRVIAGCREKKTKQKERQHRCIDSVSVAFKKEKKKKLQDYGFRLFTAVGFYPITLFS